MSIYISNSYEYILCFFIYFNMKKIKLLIIIIAFILSFPIHFLYELFPCFFTSIIAPVNESIWEHMKIIFTSILISSIIEYFIYKYKKITFNNFFIAVPVSAILGIIFYLIVYLFIDLFIPHIFIIAIILMLITYIFSEIISYKIMNKKELTNQKEIGLFLILISYIIFTHLTYYPPKSFLFIDSLTKEYGI